MTQAYCQLGDLQDRLSALGVSLRTDDAPPDAYGNAILRAGVTIEQYCGPRYSLPSLLGNDWVTQTATTLAVKHLCGRRGNPVPQSLLDDYKEAMEELKQVRKGQLPIFGAAVRRQGCPVMSNVRVRLRPEPHSRREPARSTTTGGRPTDYTVHQDNVQQEGDYSAG